MKYVETKSGVHLYELDNFSMEHIINSGQCFRWSRIATNTYAGVAKGHYLEILQSPNEATALFKCSLKEFENLWYDYFDFSRDYQSIVKLVTDSDSFLTSAVRFGSGLRILKQDPWECLVTFIISQQNNIPRITGIIERLCNTFGELKEKNGIKYRCFPTPQQIIDKYHLLGTVGLGYRDKYILAAAIKVSDELYDLEDLRRVDSVTCTNRLKEFYGVGDKVANCISLFGLGHTDAFPIDVWIRRIIDEYYNGEFDMTKYSPYSGIIQQYMFYYGRMIKQ